MDRRQFITDQIIGLGGSEAEAEGSLAVLVGLGSDIVPQLMADFWRAPDPRVRARLVQVIAEARLESSLTFLAEAMDDLYDATWMNALDGIVAIGGMPAVNILHDLFFTMNSDDHRKFWIREALDQVLATIPGRGAPTA